ncbi:hypothetical protein CBR_g54201 [Chara braunii]|uniref:AIG1-type G domain-containing protein n=1 Tax=Chara braunii TaxID=69332 RepID=A0A388K7A7_CHABU|nr:hypothetical protein CBR_g54201 [Chara braunii]|eukprot:GBG65909.1 hypothetical protein CBR_g54201 [Chara braunii]
MEARGSSAPNGVREWMGIMQFPVATQASLHDLLARLRKDNRDSLTILVLGKCGVGKSSTVNSIFGERVCVVSAFQSETIRPTIASRTRAGFTLNIIDTPGLVEAGCVSDEAFDAIRKFLLDRPVDAVLYVDRLDSYRVDSLDHQVMTTLTRIFGPLLWKIALLVLTRGQIVPPDGTNYSEFVSRRTEALREAIHQAAKFKKSDPQIPTVVVENSGRCATNDDGEKVLPDKTVWIPNLVRNIVEVVTGEKASTYTVDERTIKGSHGSWWPKLMTIPLFLFQLKVVYPLIRAQVFADIDEGEEEE